MATLFERNPSPVNDVGAFGYGGTWRAQTFFVTSRHTITTIRLWLSQTLQTPGTVIGNLDISIQGLGNGVDGSGNPTSNVPIAPDLTIISVPASSLPSNNYGSYQVFPVDIILPNPITLYEDTEYSFCMRLPSVLSVNNTVYFGRTAPAITSVGRYLEGWAGSFWDDGGATIAFEIYGDPIAVNPPAAGFDALVSGFTVTLTDRSTGATSYSWDFGDSTGSVEVSPIHTYAAGTPGTNRVYRITQTVTNSAGQSQSYVDVTIVTPAIIPPVVSFTPDKVQGVGSLTVQFNNHTTGQAPITYLWNFGDGTTSVAESPSHTFGIGTFNVVLTATNAGGSVQSGPTTIMVSSVPLPVASFVPTRVSGPSPLTVGFANTSLNSNQWQWFFGDGALSTVFEPTHEYINPGSYDVILTATGPGGTNTSVAVTITVTAPVPGQPVANFIPSLNTVNTNTPVTFNNYSQNATSYQWSFGDGEGSTVETPTHSYKAEGTYPVTLIAYGANNTSNTFGPVYIQVAGEATPPQSTTPVWVIPAIIGTVLVGFMLTSKKK